MNGSDFDVSERNLPSLRRTLSTNGSSYSERDRNIQLRPYSSFGKNNRDKDSDFLEKRKPGISENGNSVTFTRSNVRNSISKASFEREFPSLRNDEKHGSHEISRVSSPGLSSAVQNLPLGSALLRGDGWTSALAEVPAIVGLTASQQVSSISSSSSSGLNMAEALAQAPPKARSSPKLSVDSQRLEEFAIRQSRQLVPVTPSTSRASVLSSSEKLKLKVSRGGAEYGVLSKVVGQPPLAQLVGHALRVSKPAPAGNFHVLNLDRSNGGSPAGRGPQGPATPPSKAKSTLPLRSEGRGGGVPVTAFAERRPPIIQQNRSEFFNSLRKKTATATSGNSLPAESPASEKPNEPDVAGSEAFGGSKGESPSNDTQSSPHSNGQEAEKGSSLDPEEEERLLRLFGWKENAGEEEEALTAEEIDAFMEEYQKRRPASKFGLRNLNISAAQGGGDSDEGSQASQGEGC
ncbi:uncharacterized protein LOC144701824 isoform X2 [Wolffia australiana]